MIVLNVKFTEKEQVKQLGARWDPISKIWFVPDGVDVTLFKAWLPQEVLDQLQDKVIDFSTKEQTLCQYLARFSQVVANAANTASWLIAEISELKANNHAYLTFVEHDATGKLIARCNASIWQQQYLILNQKFKQATGNNLTAGIKVLVQVTATLHVVHGFSLNVVDLDPNYTLGDMAANIAKIRQQLQQTNLYLLNKKLPLPKDYSKLVVIAPNNAAGLGDFKREADLLVKYSLCEFIYLNAVFQGETCAASIIEQITIANGSYSDADALIIIRGGGALSDLAWLNNLELATYVCRSKLPVLVGIGHERDYTILDEIAAIRFDTPSKVIAKIMHTITQNALTAEQDWQLIGKSALNIVNFIDLKLLNNITNINQDANNKITTVSSELFILQQGLVAKASEQLIRAMNLAETRFKQIISAIDLISVNISNKIVDLHKALLTDVNFKLQFIEQQLKGFIEQILLQNPENVLKKGFALVTHNGQAVITKVQAIRYKKLNIKFQDGEIEVVNEQE